MTENTSYDEKQVVITVRRDSVILLLIHWSLNDRMSCELRDVYNVGLMGWCELCRAMCLSADNKRHVSYCLCSTLCHRSHTAHRQSQSVSQTTDPCTPPLDPLTRCITKRRLNQSWVSLALILFAWLFVTIVYVFYGVTWLQLDFVSNAIQAICWK